MFRMEMRYKILFSVFFFSCRRSVYSVFYYFIIIFSFTEDMCEVKWKCVYRSRAANFSYTCFQSSLCELYGLWSFLQKTISWTFLHVLIYMQCLYTGLQKYYVMCFSIISTQYIRHFWGDKLKPTQKISNFKGII